MPSSVLRCFVVLFFLFCLPLAYPDVIFRKKAGSVDGTGKKKGFVDGTGKKAGFVDGTGKKAGILTKKEAVGNKTTARQTAKKKMVREDASGCQSVGGPVPSSWWLLLFIGVVFTWRVNRRERG